MKILKTLKIIDFGVLTGRFPKPFWLKRAYFELLLSCTSADAAMVSPVLPPGGLAKSALQLAEDKLDMQFQGLSSAAATLAKHSRSTMAIRRNLTRLPK